MLKPYEIKVWALRDEGLPGLRENLEKLKRLLHPEEAARIARRINPMKRDRSMAARYMIWRTLAAHLGENWETLNREQTLRARDLSYRDIYWSITHTEGVTMVAFSLNKRVGIDAEALRSPRRRDVLKIAEKYFDEEERAVLFSCSPYLAEENFFRLWTTKEAHYKYISFGNFYSFLRKSCLYLQADKDVWGLKWERDFFFTVVAEKHPESTLEVKSFSEKLFP